MTDVALEIARLPGLTADLLALIERALLPLSGRDGVVSVHAVQAEMQDRFRAILKRCANRRKAVVPSRVIF